MVLDIAPPNSTAQGKRINGRTGRVFHTAEHKRDMEAIVNLMKSNPHRPKEPLTGAVSLAIEGFWPHLKSTKKSELGNEFPKTTKPDIDNWAKGIIDCLVEAGYLASDQIVWRLSAYKKHSHTPRIVISGKVTKGEK